MKYAMLGLGLMLVMLACSFAMSLLVVEWRGADGEDGEDQISVDRQGEWVACQVSITNQLFVEGAKVVYLTSDLTSRLKDECGITSDLWMMCVHGAVLDLSEEETAGFGATEILKVAEQCRQELR